MKIQKALSDKSTQDAARRVSKHTWNNTKWNVMITNAIHWNEMRWNYTPCGDDWLVWQLFDMYEKYDTNRFNLLDNCLICMRSMTPTSETLQYYRFKK